MTWAVVILAVLLAASVGGNVYQLVAGRPRKVSRVDLDAALKDLEEPPVVVADATAEDAARILRGGTSASPHWRLGPGTGGLATECRGLHQFKR